MADVDGDVTPVASEKSDEAVRAAISAAAALAQEQGPPQPRAPPAETVANASQAIGQAPATAARVLGPLGTAPYGAQASSAASGLGAAAQPPPVAGSRSGQRERSPRREAEASAGTPTRADVDEEETPQLSRAAADAALRGDSIPSLPELEDDTPQVAASNPRGGALL